jgi:uncharacterized membrane protein
MSKEKKNPIVAGVLNMFIPGAGYLFVDNDRGRFIKTLIGGVLLIAVVVVLANAIQNIRGYSLPQGLCPGVLLMLVFVPLFLAGQKTASLHNNMIDNTAHYNVLRTSPQGSDKARLGRIQEMRDEGLISEQEYDKKKKDLSP